MTATQLTFYFDYSSPFAYLGATQVAAVAAKHDVPLSWHPMLLGGLFRAIGTPMVPLFEMPPNKQAYQRKDMGRWAQHYDQPFSFPSRFPMNTISALRMTLQLDNVKRPQLALPLFRAYWAEDRDINDAAVLREVADAAGFDGEALLAGCAKPEVKASLRSATEQAQQAGVFGAPTYLVKAGADDAGMLFWGQDRMPLIERALDGWRPDCG